MFYSKRWRWCFVMVPCCSLHLLLLRHPSCRHASHPPTLVIPACLQLQDGGNMRRSARLRALYSDRRRHNVLFDNLHHRDTAPGGGRAETRAGLALLTAAEWCVALGWVGW